MEIPIGQLIKKFGSSHLIAAIAEYVDGAELDGDEHLKAWDQIDGLVLIIGQAEPEPQPEPPPDHVWGQVQGTRRPGLKNPTSPIW